MTQGPLRLSTCVRIHAKKNIVSCAVNSFRQLGRGVDLKIVNKCKHCAESLFELKF